jgi:hypothetical protein
VDRRLRDIPLEWHWRRRSDGLGWWAVNALWLGFVLALPFDNAQRVRQPPLETGAA